MGFGKSIFVFLVVALSVITASGQKAIPELWGQRIHDEAHALNQETVDQLERQLSQYEDSTSNQIAVLIIQSLEGEVLEDYSLKVVEKWKLGTKANDNGVLVLVAIDDHKMRIEVGLGLEGVLTDALCNRIIRNEMAPAFRRDDYDAGIMAVIQSVVQAIGGEYSSADQNENSVDNMDLKTKIIVGVTLFCFLGFFAGVGLFSEGYMTWVLYVFLIPFYAIFMGLILGWWWFYGYLILYPLLRIWVIKSGRELLEWQSGRIVGSGGGWSSSGSSGSSFSGGGGSFGGGGSSGGW
ncbi:MAG: TPM domain-containing protein [Cyclobacteriaceae bacterium]